MLLIIVPTRPVLNCEEVEGCNGERGHIRTTPKRALGVGHIIPLAPEDKAKTAVAASGARKAEEEQESCDRPRRGDSFFGGGAVLATPLPEQPEQVITPFNRLK